jgi:tRNA-Thr(GGU) m(6)t(6)A37 methyltransferase TsaA
MTLALQPIGVIHTPFKEKKNMPIQPASGSGANGTVEVFAEYRVGLRDLAGFSHIILLYHFHKSKKFNLQVVPFLDTEPRGLFATRAPNRPNPIGLSVVQLDSVEDNLLHIRNVDILDNTPLLDIKPYVPDFDAPTEVRTGWLEKAREKVANRKSDDRFK